MIDISEDSFRVSSEEDSIEKISWVASGEAMVMAGRKEMC